ncbi:hypothetical protein GGR54DRAFT_314933 [Hypoxylon sp. NC1633]|nr:hypothetical protein GGR54DRAFT_314933 [Hypoxylon sp. NC1633]
MMPVAPSVVGFGRHTGPPQSRPIWKKKPHRRSPQACDECRLRKRACDAGEPCGPCRHFNLGCTYQFRRPLPAPTLRIRNLQDHLRLARSWLRVVREKVIEIPGLDLDKCLRILDFTLPDTQSQSPSSPTSADHASNQPTLTSMLAGYDRLVAVGSGAVCFYGAHSELSFILRTLEIFKKDPAPLSDKIILVISDLFNLPFPMPDNINPTLTIPLPSHDLDFTMALVDAVFARNHPMLSFLHEQQVRDIASMFAENQLSSISDQSLSLLHLTLALGCLFDSPKHQEEGCRNILQRGMNHYHVGLSLLKLMQVNDQTSLQATLCAIIFLISTSRIVSAHPLIGTACSSALRLGLHSVRSSSTIPAEDRKIRTGLLATIMRLDLYASLILDLPPFLQRDAISLSHIPHLAEEAEAEGDLRTAATLRQVCLLAIPVSKRTYNSAGSLGSNTEPVDIGLFEEAKREFQSWRVEASSLLGRLGQGKDHKYYMHDLEMTYNFCHIILFRPLLHYLRILAEGGSISVIQSYHALACIKIASSTIARSHDMIKEGLLLTGLWPSIYTIFLSVMCLIFLIAAHRGTERPSQAWQRAAVGTRLIAAFECEDDCSTNCVEVLKTVISKLSHTIYFDIDEIEASVVRHHASRVDSPATINPHEDASRKQQQPPSVTRTPTWLDIDFQSLATTPAGPENQADRMFVQAEGLSTEFDFRDTMQLSDEE